MTLYCVFGPDGEAMATKLEDLEIQAWIQAEYESGYDWQWMREHGYTCKPCRIAEVAVDAEEGKVKDEKDM